MPQPLRKLPDPEPIQEEEVLARCSVCGLSFREADDCLTPFDCSWNIGAEKRE